MTCPSQVLCGWACPLWPGLTLPCFACHRPGRGQGHRRRQAWGPTPGFSAPWGQQDELANAQEAASSQSATVGRGPTPLLCSCLLLKAILPSVKVGASLVTQPSLIQALALLLSWLSVEGHWPRCSATLRLPLPCSHLTPHTPLSPAHQLPHT